jgi:hypothetical protein
MGPSRVTRVEVKKQTTQLNRCNQNISIDEIVSKNGIRPIRKQVILIESGNLWTWNKCIENKASYLR